ncbi:MAG: biotin/lipoyl-binding protein, partial [Acidobacteriaceae bacterium]
MNIRKLFSLRRIIWLAIIILVVGGIGYKIVSSKNKTGSLLTDTVKRLDLKQTVLATGELTSKTDLNLSFKATGVVRRVNVAVNSKVKAGDVIANLEQKDQQAALTSARGSLASAQANYQRVLDGASNEEVQVAQKSVDAAAVTLDNAKLTLENTKTQQKVLVDNAYSSMLNAGLTAVPATSNLNTTPPTVSGTYTGTVEGTYTVRQTGKYYYTSGLETTGDVLYSSTTPTPLGTRGLYLTFPSTMQISTDSWTVDVPNKNSSTYLTYFNAYKSAQESQTTAVAS